MTRCARPILGLFVALAFLASGPIAHAADKSKLDLYALSGPADKIAAATQGFELDAITNTDDGVSAQAVLTKAQAEKIRKQGINVKLVRNKKGDTVSEQAAKMAVNGYTVWRDYDSPGGFRAQEYQLAANNPNLVQLNVIGHTVQGREILALKVTENAKKDNKRPTVLYSSLQHAREWISSEVNRRTLNYFLDQYKSGNAEIKQLLQTTELWFVLVANPDGYQYTFDHERLWRKNLHDNNGDGKITPGDGVDPNRNFDAHWGYDDEGSSNDPLSETYRGPKPASEPETQAMQNLIKKIKPKFQSNLHSFGQWLLYPQGWQTGTLDADNPIYAALAGLDTDPAIADFDPGQSADTLYVTNGETTDYADATAGTVSFTPELGEGEPGSGFVFPDNEALVQAEFKRILPFHLSLAKSAADPAHPVSSKGIAVKPFYLDQDEIDPQNGQQSLFDFKFDVSYGDPQEVRVLAARSLKEVKLAYQINGGKIQRKGTKEWKGGKTYGPGTGEYYHVVSANVEGAKPGDSVKVWFESGDVSSGSFAYKLVTDTKNKVLVVAAEDYTGASTSPAYPAGTGPRFLQYYTDALDANKVKYDVYDVDGNGRTAPDNLGVLSHYKAVIWYTGNDRVTRVSGWGPGNADRLAQQEIYEFRDYMNEGGSVAYTGQEAGAQYTQALGTQLYDPVANQQCHSDPAIEARCLPLSGSGDAQGDPLEYWFGAAILSQGAGSDENGDPFPIAGLTDPFGGLTLGRGADSADNQAFDASFITTQDYLSILDPASSFPQFASKPAATYATGISGGFEPHDGSSFLWSQLSDQGYKRLTHTINVPATGAADLKFWTSYNLEQDWDYLTVEAHTVGQDDWTTLPDDNHNTSSSLEDSQSCLSGWSDPNGGANEIHPFLENYETFVDADTPCENTGKTGSWNGATGNSGGWQQWSIDLTPYAGKSIEVSITVLSDWATQQFPGTFIDQIEGPGGQGTTSFEGGDMGGWTVPGAPGADGQEGPNANDWLARGGLGIKEGAAIATPQSLYLGFGFEGVSGQANRNALMKNIVKYLLH